MYVYIYIYIYTHVLYVYVLVRCLCQFKHASSRMLVYCVTAPIHFSQNTTL